MIDLIDREAILKDIEKIRQNVQMMDDTHRVSITMGGIWLCEKAVMNQPSAQPESKKGRWVVEHGVFMNDGIYGDLYRCSVCGYRERNPEGFNYCPNCGAKMEVTE